MVEHEKTIAEAKQAIAEANKATLKAKLPDSEVNALEGTLTIDDKVAIECQILTYKAMSEIAFQISKNNQRDAASLIGIESDNEIMTEYLDFHLAEAALTMLKDPTKEIELKNFRGLMLPKNFYFNHLIMGQDGAIGMNIKIEGNYSGKVLDQDYHSRTL